MPGHRIAKPNQAIQTSTSVRSQHGRLLCDLCHEYPSGFRGEYELRRHLDRAHAANRKAWICCDPLAAKSAYNTPEDLRPTRPLDGCRQCQQQKPYNVSYNAAAHLRRVHFRPRKRGRKARGEKREVRGGNCGGDWPSMAWLKEQGWLRQNEVVGSSHGGGTVPAAEGTYEMMSDGRHENGNSQPAVAMSTDRPQQQFPLQTLPLEGFSQSSTPNATLELGMHISGSATATAGSQKPSTWPRFPQSFPHDTAETQVSGQSPQTASIHSAGDLSTSESNDGHSHGRRPRSQCGTGQSNGADQRDVVRRR